MTIRNPTAAHVAPFAAWLALMHFLDLPQLPAAWAYAIRAGLCVALLLVCRPWRWYAPPALRHVPLAVGVGLFVLVAWVGLEGPWMDAAPGVREAYQRWLVLPLGGLRELDEATPYAPGVCGWPLAIMRLLGSGLVIALIEEFFWRGFVYRWMSGKDFTQVDPGRLTWVPFLLTAVVFASEHAELGAGLVAGLAYGWLYLRTRDIWAATLAHMVTNLLLGAYVLATGQYFFW